MARKTTKSSMKDKIDAALEELTSRVISSIEEDPGNWTKPWREILGGGLPVNAHTKKRYSGGNLFWLSLVANNNGWSNVWGTYKQWEKLGCQVRKGSSGTLGMFYKPIKITEEKDGREVEKTIPILRGFYLFNADQVEGADEVVAERFGQGEIEPVDIIAHAEEFFAAVSSDLRHGGDRAFYRHGDGSDYIQVPVRDSFVSPEAYYATLSHEHVHWTGHPSRLNRTKGKHFGDNLYAREELVAQLGAAFVLTYLGIDTDARGCQIESYLASWLKTLKESPRALWSVLGDASKALDFLTEQAGENGYDDLEEEAA